MEWLQPESSSFYVNTVTATSDAVFQVETDLKVILTSCNIACYSNDCYYGNAGYLSGIIRKDDVVFFEHTIRIADLLFKNYTAGSNTQIVITGTLMK